MTDASSSSQVVKRVKYKSSVKAPGVDGILKMTRERFTFRPNDPSKSASLNVEFRLIKGSTFIYITECSGLVIRASSLRVSLKLVPHFTCSRHNH
ncbi:hypothetical protein Tco_0036299 [Tanacetum coccineum]